MGSVSVAVACCLLVLASAAHGSAAASTTTADRPTTSGGGLPLWVQRLLAAGSGEPSLGSMGGKSVVVSKDSSGQFRTINEALQAAAAEDPPVGNNKVGRFTIFLKEGVYEETVQIRRRHVIIIGEGPGKSVITGGKSAASDHLSMPDTATLSVYGRGFMAQGITVRNTAGPAGEQAVALRSRSHFSLIYRCSIEGFQDTLDADTGLQMYLESSIHGTIDFIFGYARAAFLGCRLLVRHPGTATRQNFVTAQGRSNPNDNSGFVFQNCSLTADAGVDLAGIETFLGRPWKNHSHVMFMESFLGSIVHAQGWVEWKQGKSKIPETVLYLEYGNTGPGADTARRLKSAAVRVASCSEAEGYTADRFVNASQWMPAEPKEEVTIP